ncbi:MAG: YjbH domain-containing protein, partial [Chlamydiae bacterium]|nr:YjbH domain-containing protein [Chlamydiota bacterium]
MRVRLGFLALCVIGPSFLLFAETSSLNKTQDEVAELFRNLSLVKKINHEIHEHLPYSYNYSLIMGYFAMPSARMAPTGMAALGYSYASPYNNYSLNFQMFSHIELVGNYRVFKGIQESGFGHMGFGDDTDRTASVKFALYQQGKGLKYIPSLSFGFDDFYGSRRFYSFYVCATEELLNCNLELTLGYGHGRIRGFYGGLAWTPLRQTSFPLLKDLTFMAEYDANNYKHHLHEHPKGRKVHSPINVGLSLNLFDFLQFKVSSIRGSHLAASAALYYNIGSSKGFFPKVRNPPFYTAPVDVEPVSYLRTEEELAQELAYAFCEQGLNLYRAYLMEGSENTLWLKIINTRYREELQVRDRIQHLLATLMPSNISSTIVVIEADGIPTQAYFFRTKDLERFREGKIGDYELKAISPMMEGSATPQQPATLIYKRSKDIWTFTFRPRLITFFGSTTGKIKYSTGFIAGLEGYLFDSIYYKTQISYNIASSLANLRGIDMYNLSHLPIVRSDSILYYQGHNFSLEQAYLQKGYNVGRGWYTRFALGYFEPAYGGIAFESLYYPVGSSWALGIEAAGVLKRTYHGAGF